MNINFATLTPASFTQYFIITYRSGVEGGYVNHSDDLGGATNYGITEATAKEWKELWPKYNWNGDMKTLPYDLAYEIYVKGWWDRLLLNEVAKIHPVLCDRLFDWSINSGRARAVEALQRILNVCNREERDYPDLVVDGGMGTKTINALKAFMAVRGKDGLRYLITTHDGMQKEYYVAISEKRKKNESFTNGWLRRGYDNSELYAYLMVNKTL